MANVRRNLRHMKTQEHRNRDPFPGAFEADLEAGIDALFGRCPTLCGFSVRDAESLAQEGLAVQDTTALFVTEVSVYPQTCLEPPPEICHEIVASLIALVDECPETRDLLRERTFARVFH